MQHENIPNVQGQGLALWVLNVVKDHYGWIFAVVAALSPLAGIVNLAIYTHYIGRPDALLPSLELGPGLVVLWLAYILAFVLILGAMLITSLILSGLFGWLRPFPGQAEKVVRQVIALTGAAMLGIIVPIGVAYAVDGSAGPAWLLSVFIPPAVFSWSFIRANGTRVEALVAAHTLPRKLLACATLTVMVGATAFCGMYPATFVEASFEAKLGVGDWQEKLLFCFVTMIASMSPAIGYFIAASKGKRAQIKAALSGVLLFLGVLVLTMPSLLSLPSLAAAKLLGVSDRTVKRYLISNEEYPAHSLDAKKWALSFSQEKQYLVEGFALYSYGAVVLLCPASLAKIWGKDLDQYTAQCIAFERRAVKSLDVAQRDSQTASAN
ncbi:hypothetical protein ACKI1H_17220 [Pseudomonas sp. YH-1]|uniref:hypothetical protein n=1 Tax=Pseudomonas sp. YH-1 TaxID=3384787 RepID=UPI003F8011F6